MPFGVCPTPPISDLILFVLHVLATVSQKCQYLQFEIDNILSGILAPVANGLLEYERQELRSHFPAPPTVSGRNRRLVDLF